MKTRVTPAGCETLSGTCQRGPARSATALLALLLPLAAAAADAPMELPRRKSGLWEFATSVQGTPAAAPIRACIDERFDDLGRQLTEGAVSCSKQEVHRQGDGILAESVCRIGESTVTTRTVFLGSFDAAYRADIRSTYAPPLLGRAEGQATIDAKWLGPCPPGQRAGDMTLPNGMTINLYDARDRAARK